MYVVVIMISFFPVLFQFLYLKIKFECVFDVICGKIFSFFSVLFLSAYCSCHHQLSKYASSLVCILFLLS